MAAGDLFNDINHAVLDLQAADLQSYGLPLKRLGRLLRHPDLADINQSLTEGLDVDALINAGEQSHRGIGSADFPWPDEDRQILGVQLLLILKFADKPDEMANFGHSFLFSGSKIMGSIDAVTSQIVIPFARDYKAFVLSLGKTETRLVMPLTKKVFIVHGHDGEARETVARFLGNIGFEPIILHEQANRGRTVIEKVEANGDVSFAVVLLTPDDLGRGLKDADLEPRARQNVLLELGYFIGKLGRDKVCALKRGTLEIPSDFAGVVWETMDDNGGWKQRLARELKAAGHVVDWNDVMK